MRPATAAAVAAVVAAAAAGAVMGVAARAAAAATGVVVRVAERSKRWQWAIATWVRVGWFCGPGFAKGSSAAVCIMHPGLEPTASSHWCRKEPCACIGKQHDCKRGHGTPATCYSGCHACCFHPEVACPLGPGCGLLVPAAGAEVCGIQGVESLCNRLGLARRLVGLWEVGVVYHKVLWGSPLRRELAFVAQYCIA